MTASSPPPSAGPLHQGPSRRTGSPPPRLGAVLPETRRARSGAERFWYSAAPLVDLRPARQWTPLRGGMCGVQSNAHIIATYQALDTAMARYLGAPSLSSWVSFAKYAAREVGSWIRFLETLLRLVQPVGGPGESVRRLRLGGSLLRLVREDGLLALCTGPLRARLEGQPMQGGLPSLSAPHRLAGQLLEQGWTARNGLVEGNTELYHRLAFAFDVFLRAEGEGRSGVTALQEVIAARRLEDPQSHLLRGFSLYREAHLMGARARARGGAQERRRVLESRRRSLVLEANLWLAVQEQSLVLHRPTIFAHPLLHALMGGIRPGQLQLTLAALPGGAGYHRFEFLPEGGNWADFEVRMGFQDVTDAAERPMACFPVSLPGRPGELRHYQVDFHRPGTIVDLFSRYLDGPACELLLRGYPRDIHPL